MIANRDKLPKGCWMNVAQSVGVAVIVLLLYAYYASTGRSFNSFRAAIDTCAKPFCDFASFYYPMGEAIFRTGLPLTGFVYSPFIAILSAVFPFFGLNILWGIVQFAFIILYLLLFCRLVPSGQLTQLLFVFLALSSFPLLHTLTWGQVSIFTFNLIGDRILFGTFGLIFWSNLILLVASYMELLPIALRQINSTSAVNLFSRVMERRVSHDTQ